MITLVQASKAAVYYIQFVLKLLRQVDVETWILTRRISSQLHVLRDLMGHLAQLGPH